MRSTYTVTVFNYEEAQFKDCQEVILRFDGIDTIADPVSPFLQE